MEELFTTTDIWQAAAFLYLYGVGCLASITDNEGDDRRRLTTYGIAGVPSEDAKIVVDDYQGCRLTLASAKDFVNAFNIVTKQQKAMRLRGDSDWRSKRWIEGKC